jgi:hypothetical protein
LCERPLLLNRRQARRVLFLSAQNVEVDYFTRRTADNTVLHDHLSFWNTDYGDLTKVAFSVENGNFAEIVTSATVRRRSISRRSSRAVTATAPSRRT